MKRKTLLLMVALLCMVAQGAWADNAVVKYLEKSWDEEQSKLVSSERSITDYTVLSGSHPDDWYQLGDGSKDFYYVVNGSVSYKTLVVYGRVHLILTDNSWLTCTGGIKLEKQNDAELFIYSQRDGDIEGAQEGRLVVTNSNRLEAGIGSGEAQDGAPLTIHGGVIDATGAPYGAGIGGGAANNERELTSGDVTVYGGRVTGRGGDSGAGIGGAATSCTVTIYEKLSKPGKFTIYGGMVSAIGGNLAAGVGGGGGFGYFVDTNTRGGDGGYVYVYGGNLTAQGGNCGAGIGSGYEADRGGTFIIYGGTVLATGGEGGAGIGGGEHSPGGTATIYGGNVTAQGGKDGAGIGSGNYMHKDPILTFTKTLKLGGGVVTISGGDVVAKGGGEGAGIGGGLHGFGADVSITGGTVIAQAGEGCDAREEQGGCAIGCGARYSKIYEVSTYYSLFFADPNGKLNLNYYRLLAGNNGASLEDSPSAADRNNYCRWRNYVHITPCPHTPLIGDDASKVITYTLDDDNHTSHCYYCGYSVTEAHSYSDAGDCVCGKKNDAVMVTITIYRSSAGASYGEAETWKVVKDHEYVLPQQTDTEGFHLMGYLKTASKPASIEMLDDEFTQLVDAGEIINPEADVTYYARYRYDYAEEWTWAEDYSEATVTVTWIMGQSKLENLVATIYPDLQEPTADEEGHCRYTATYAYEKATGVTYNFSNNVNIPYLNTLTLADASDNEDAINDNSGSKVKTLTLSGRTLYKDGSWNTLCLPFDMTAGQVTAQLAPTQLKTLSESSYANGKLTLTFADATTITAGQPYLIKWDDGSDMNDPAFTDVTISGALANVDTDYITFAGTYSPVGITADNNNVLYLAADNKLYYPTAAMTIGACRGVFCLNGITAGDLPGQVRSFVLDFGQETTGIATVDITAGDAWYTLDGRRLSAKPTQKGLYINNGRKTVIK
ncbi:MAG: hypothetical protein K5683_00640 [Prevotella sp.]|nr:hypothetical protein [Prevotella sp.]